MCSGGAFFRPVASCRVALRRVASCRVRRCSLREPPAAKHGSTSLRLSGRAWGFRWVFFSVPFRLVLPCRVALRPVLSRRVASRRVASRRVRRCSLWEPPAVKHGSTSLRLSGRTEGASGGCSSPFCSVLFCPVASRCVASCRVLSRRVALRPVASRRVASRRVRRCSLWEPPAAKHGSTSLRLSGRTEGASGGCSSPFCSVLSWNASNNF